MRNRLTTAILTVVAVLACPPAILAQTSAGSGGAKGKPDLSGIWDSSGGSGLTGPGAFAPRARDSKGGVPAAAFTKEEPSMQPWALDKYRARREGISSTERGLEAADPVMYPYCMPPGFPRVYNFDPLVEIVQTPDQVYMHFEFHHQTRRIYLDGRKHLEGWPATFQGTSQGRWDGDTLVVETENILSLNKEAWLDGLGHPFTDALRVTERVRRLNHDTLQIDFVFDDPRAYTKPWAGKKTFQLRPDWDMTDWMICDNHMREDFLRDIKNGKPAGRP